MPGAGTLSLKKKPASSPPYLSLPGSTTIACEKARSQMNEARSSYHKETTKSRCSPIGTSARPAGRP